MNTPVKRAKSTALGKKCNPSAVLPNPKRIFTTENDRKGAVEYRKGRVPEAFFLFQRKPQSVLKAYRSSGNRSHQHSQCFDIKT